MNDRPTLKFLSLSGSQIGGLAEETLKELSSTVLRIEGSDRWVGIARVGGNFSKYNSYL